MRRIWVSALLLFSCFAFVCFAGEVEIKPDFSEFSVVFPKQPTGKTVGAIRGDGQYDEGLSFELLIGETLLRAEFVEVQPGILDKRSDKELSKVMLDTYRQSGVKNAGVDVEHRGKMRVVNGRGTKMILMEGRKVPVTYLNQSFYGRHSMMHLTIGAPAEVFPTKEVFPFLDSVSF